jgi:hypothetical protein
MDRVEGGCEVTAMSWWSARQLQIAEHAAHGLKAHLHAVSADAEKSGSNPVGFQMERRPGRVGPVFSG